MKNRPLIISPASSGRESERAIEILIEAVQDRAFERHEEKPMAKYEDLTRTIGHTPLVELHFARDTGATLIGKVESMNPLGSVKDRVAVSMIDDAEARGALEPGGTVIEATSGNTGIGLAFVCASRGYRCMVVMPNNVSVERMHIMAVLGVRIELTDGRHGMSESTKRAEELAAETPNSFVARQFENPANPRIHRETTAREIWDDTEGAVDIFVAGVGTGGTITGVGEVLKDRKPSVQVIAVEPEYSAVLSGKPAGQHKITGIGAGFVPKVLNRELIDEIIKVNDDDAAAFTRLLATREGILAGVSSGAAVYAAMEVAGRPENKGKTIVAVLPDTGERYLTSWIFTDTFEGLRL